MCDNQEQNTEVEMPTEVEIIGVKFKPTGKVYYLQPINIKQTLPTVSSSRPLAVLRSVQ